MISQGEYIIFILIVSLLLYTRPNVLVNFSKSTIGKIILLITLIFATLRSTFHGILIALVIVVFAEQIYEGFTDTTTQQITINGNQMIQTPDKTKMVEFGGNKVQLYETSSVENRVYWKFIPVQGKANHFYIQNTWHCDKGDKRCNYYITYTGYDAIIGPGRVEWELIKTEKPGVFYIKNGCNEPNSRCQDYLGYNSVGNGVRLTINKNPSEFYIDGSIAPTPAPAPAPATTSTELKCPEGYEGPNASGDCTTLSTQNCNESCAKDNCSKGGGQWVPLDYATNPFTCKMKAPKPACGGDKTDNGFVNFPYEYIEQHTNADTDVVATDPNAQYFKVKTQTMTGCTGGSHQFKIHTPAYKPSEGDTAQITINEYTGNYGSTGGPIAMINGGKWYHKDGQIPVLVYNTGGGCMNGAVTLSILILKGNQ